ncbi:MAG: cytochrome c oxidase subunit 3 family protein [Geobacteraceae bacterium]|nr:cytochrome c oxidase subunit 3 family protein [Geobacteraceae bacterium]
MSEQLHRDKSGATLGMWLFLLTELILFGGLFLLYAVYLARYPHEFASGGKELNVVFGAVNTVVLLTSSLLAAMAVTAVQRGAPRTSIRLLLGTIGCALIFLGIKYVEWNEKFGHDIYPSSQRLIKGPQGESVFFSLYFLTTGLHGLHVLIGATLLGFVAVRVQQGRVDSNNNSWLENGALYWHLVDLIWIFIFPLYYLIL